MKKVKRIYLIITALLISAPFLVFGLTSCSKTKDKDGKTDGYNYYTSVYHNLNDTDNVFRSIVWNGLNQLLDTEGATYIILFGGAHDEGTQEVIPYINEFAKIYGASDIYVFDFKLDGSLGEALGVNADISSENHEYNGQYYEISKKLSNYEAVSGNTDTFRARIPVIRQLNDASYVTAEGEPLLSGTVIDLTPRQIAKIKTPTLLVYNKSLPSGPVLAVEDSVYSKDELKNDATKRDAYKAKLDAFFQKAVLSLRGNGTNKVKTDTFDYYSAEKMRIREGDGAGSAYLPASHILQPVTYHELIDMFENKKYFPLFFGGEWCPNTQAVIKYVNELGKYYSLEKIYVFDFRLDGITAQPDSAYYTYGETNESGTIVKSGRYAGHSNIRGDFNPANFTAEALSIRAGETAYGRLYVKLLSYLKDFTSKWNDKVFGAEVQDIVRIDSKDYTRICSPAFILFDKDLGVAAGYEAEYRWGNHIENPGQKVLSDPDDPLSELLDPPGTGDKTSIAYRFVHTGLVLVFERYIELYNPGFVPDSNQTDGETKAPVDPVEPGNGEEEDDC